MTTIEISTAKIKPLLDLIDREGNFLYRGKHWLNLSQPEIAARLEVTRQTVINWIKRAEKAGAIVRWRTRINHVNVTLLRRADSAPAKSQKSKVKSAKVKSQKSKVQTGSPPAAPGQDALMHAWETFIEKWNFWHTRRERLKRENRHYGLCRGLAKDGITPDMLSYALENWEYFVHRLNEQWADDQVNLKRPCLDTMRKFPGCVVQVWQEHLEDLEHEKQKALDLAELL